MLRWIVLIGLAFGCADKEPPLDTASGDTADVCAGISLAACPDECPEDWAATCGEPCETDGETCGNDLGDGRACVGGTWSCTVHAPLEPGGCNLVCRG